MITSASLYVAYGAVSAAVIAGFFSLVNLISTKENKVSEFRQAWIDGIRDDISVLTSAMFELVEIQKKKEHLEPKEYLEATSKPFKDARERTTSIQLRLNPKHVKDKPESEEAIFWNSVQETRKKLKEGDYSNILDNCDRIRSTAAPLLKKEWEKVKLGEAGYRVVRTAALITILIGVAFIGLGGWNIMHLA